MALSTWAVPQLSKLLPLDNDSLKQIIEYTSTLPPHEAAEHLTNLLGDGPQALEFITSFQLRKSHGDREAQPARSGSSAPLQEVPRPNPRARKAKQPFNKLPPPRQVQDHGDTSGGYMKRDQEDYMSSSSSKHVRKTSKEPVLANTLALSEQPDAIAGPVASHLAPSTAIRVQGSASSSRVASATTTPRSSSPALKSGKATTVNITGGTAMRGASTAVADLDSAIRSLEITTNPSLATAESTAARRCNCMAQRHPLLTAAPNCLSCGKIVCVKEGIGPCTFCGKPLLSSDEVQAMLKSLREERGQAKMDANNAVHKRAEVAKTPRPFSTPQPANNSTPGEEPIDPTLANARAHRDKLLAFQQQNAQRTRVHDEAADFETPDSGLSQWASPQERALQLKKQQRVLREQEWNARPEYEKRQMVVSLDIDSKGRGRAVKKMVGIGRTASPEIPDEEVVVSSVEPRPDRGGVFSHNPLLGNLIRPVYTPKGNITAAVPQPGTRSAWRRVQDDQDDNEEIILDGGAYGGRNGESARQGTVSA